MMSAKTMAGKVEDFASVSIELPLTKESLFNSLSNVELMYRINPHLEIKSWQEEGKGKLTEGKKISVDQLNEMNGLSQQMNLSVADIQPGASFSVRYDSGLKQATMFSVETVGAASCRLTIKEIYPADLSVTEKKGRLNEVDKSLVPWGEGIHRYFARQKRWSGFPFSNWFQDAFWLGMSPRHRRITRMIIWTTVLEFVVFMFVFVIYWLELGSGRS